MLCACLLGTLKNVNKTVFFTSITGAGFIIQFATFISLILQIAHLQPDPHLLYLYCYFHSDQLPIHHLNQAAESVLELETIESPLFHHHQREKTIDNSLNVFKQAVRENLGLVSLFLDNQSNCMLRICKTVSDDTGRILLCVVVICVYMGNCSLS